MNNINNILSWYEKISALTSYMLVLTRTRRWGELPALEAQYSDMLQQLKMIESLQALNAEQSIEKCRLLHVINSNQYDISNLIQPQLDVLGANLRNLELPQHLH